MMTKYKNIKLGIRKNSKEEFVVSYFNEESKFTDFIKDLSKDLNVSFYLLSEIKGSLDIEGDGSSRKIINELINGKRKPLNENEHKAINLHAALKYIDTVKPKITKENIMLIYNILKQNVDMKENSLENNHEYRQSKDDGFVGSKNYKTPNIEDLNNGMSDLIEFINSSNLDEYPIEKSLIIQIMFIYFHPFYDFNGRTGRLLTYWYLTLVGEDKIKNLIYLSLPENKDKYSKIWNNFRNIGYSDLTSFMNWLGTIVVHAAKKLNTILSWAAKGGNKLNETEQIIMFYLVEYNHFISVNDLMKKLDLGISKQALFKAVNSLIKMKLVHERITKNTLYVAPIAAIVPKDEPHNAMFKLMMENPDKQNLSMDDL